MAEERNILDAEIARRTAQGWHIVARGANDAQLRKPKRFSFVWAFLWFLVFGVGLLVYLLWHWAKRDELVYLRVEDGRLVVTGTRGLWAVLFTPVTAYWRWAGERQTTQTKILAYGGPIAGIVIVVIIISVAGAAGGGGDNEGAQAPAVQPTKAVEAVPREETGATAVPEPTEEPTPIPEPTKLEFTEVSVVDGDKVLISATTDLPDGATLIVGFDVAGRSDSDVYIGVDQKTTVTNGEFSVTLSVPQRDEFITGPYEISVSFTPRGQSDDVIRVVGEDGENLTGSLVDDAFGFRTMRLVETRGLSLSVAPPSYTFQQPSEFLEGSAERALAEYVFGWKNRDWPQMVRWSQKTWIDGEPDPDGVLEAWYDFKTLKGFEIRDVEIVSEVTTDITFVVHYEAIPNEISKKQITARVIRETAPYEPSLQGEWGVNPISALRETDVD